MMKTDVVIVGAGTVGLTLAYELARRGRKVAVIDRDRLVATERQSCSVDTPFRSASSWAAAGILPPANLESATDPIERLRGLSHQLYPELVGELTRTTGIDANLRRCGALYLSDSIGETASMMGMVSFWDEMGIECNEVDLAAVAKQEPELRHWTQANSQGRAWWLPDEYQVCTPLLLQALIAACEKRGVTIIGGARVTDFSEEAAESIVTFQSDGQTQSLCSDQAVLCGGVWSGLVSERLKLSQSLVPVRGQILLLKTEQPILSSVINLGQRYLVPRLNGDVLVGSCEEEVGFQHGTSPRILEDLRSFARQICPSLDAARELQAWSGLRPLTFDGFPMIGKLPESNRLFVAAGHFRSGIHLAPGTARCLADVMSGETPPVDIEPFRVGKQQMK